MAKVVKGVHALIGEYDMSGVGTGLEPSMEQEVQEYRPWNSLAVRKETGLRNDSATLSGCLELDDAGKAMFNRIGLYVPVSFHVDRWPAQVGDNSLFYQAINGSCQAGATQGDLSTFTLQLPAAQPMVLGKVLAIGEYTEDGDEAGVELPAVAAGRTVYAILHGLEVGETVDVVIETDEDDEFDTPTTRFTFTQIAAPGAQVLALPSVAGITDTWWRASITLGTELPDSTLSVSVGIF